jgi:Protein of unknown function (DUF4446)
MSASVAGWIAIGAVALAVAALALAAVLQRRLAALRSGQRSLLGSGSRDLVEFTVSLQGRIDAVHRALDELSSEISQVDRRVDGTFGHLAVVRYDAYENTGGHQSASIAFLNDARSGVVLSAIQGRDYARIYVKEIEEGRAAVTLSPEEREAVERAMRSR